MKTPTLGIFSSAVGRWRVVGGKLKCWNVENRFLRFFLHLEKLSDAHTDVRILEI